MREPFEISPKGGSRDCHPDRQKPATSRVSDQVFDIEEMRGSEFDIARPGNVGVRCSAGGALGGREAKGSTAAGVFV